MMIICIVAAVVVLFAVFTVYGIRGARKSELESVRCLNGIVGIIVVIMVARYFQKTLAWQDSVMAYMVSSTIFAVADMILALIGLLIGGVIAKARK